MGLKKKLRSLNEGVRGCSKQTNSLYQYNHTISDTRKFLKRNKFKISKIDNIDQNIKHEKTFIFTKER